MPAEAPAHAAQVASKLRRSRLGVVLRQRETNLLALLLALGLVVTIGDRSFASASNLQDLALSASFLVVLSAGMALPMLTRNLDLSVASVLALSAFVAADTLKAHADLPLVAVVGIACGIGLSLGLFNGVLVAFGNVPSIVATLGTLYLYRGIDFLLAGDGKQVNAGDLPSRFTDIANDKVLGVPVLAIGAVAVVASISVVLRWTRLGRSLYAVGSNADAARLAGIPVRRTVLIAFALSGMLAGLAGVMWVSRFAAIDSQAGLGLELTALAAVVIGGISIMGGSGSVAGAAIGALMLATIESGLAFLDITNFALEAIYGAVIVGVVIVNLRVFGRAEPGRAR
jgi:rhamnose transport system permease protein